MGKRSKDWNEYLYEQLRDIDYAQKFIITCLEEGVSLQVALGKAIRAYGIKEFSKKVNIPSSNIIRAINPNYNPSKTTLEKLLKPFSLKLTVTPVKSDKEAA